MNTMSDVELTEWLDDSEHSYLVLAESFRCFKEWCSKYSFNPYDRQIKYVTDSYHLRGWSTEKVIIVAVCDWNWAGWQKRPAPATVRNAQEIMYSIDYYRAMGTRIITDECR